MSVEVGTAYVTIIPSAKGFAAALQTDVGGAAAAGGVKAGKEYGTGLTSSAGSAIKGLAAVAVASGAIGFLKDSIAGARESAKVAALTAQAIQTTGGVANVTASQVSDLANAIAAKTGVDDEAVQSASNLLLTFTNVRNEVGKGNDVFNQATQAAVDMGAVLGGDPKSNAIALGKALNDPVKGVTALSRVGVSFTAGQKTQIAAMVKTGDTLGAQKVILGELSKEFGGAAAASGTAGDKFGVAFGNLQESIGTALLPVIDSMMTKLTGVANWIMANGTASLTILGVLLGALATHFLVMGAQALIGSAKAVLAAGQVVAGWVAAAAATAVSVGESIALWVMYSTASVVNGAKSAATWIATNATMVASTVAGWATTVATTVGGWVVMAASSLAGAAQVALAWLIAFWPIALVIAAVIALVVIVVKNWDTIKEKTVAAWEAVKSAVSAAVTGVVEFVKGLPGRITAALSAAGTVLLQKGKDIVAGLLSGITSTIGGVTSFVGGIGGSILSSLGNLGSTLVSAGGDLIRGLIQGMTGMGGQLMGFVVQFLKDHVPAPVLAMFGIHSPSTLMAKIGVQIGQGLVVGIASTGSAVQAAVDGIMPTLPTAAQLGLGGGSPAGAAGRGLAAGTNGPLIAVYPRANQSEDEIATIAAGKLMFRLASA